MRIFIPLCLFLFSFDVLAQEVLAQEVLAQEALPQESLEDPVLENRAIKLSKKLRCPVCQGQSIDSSDASIARDLRGLVRQKILQGKSDQEILHFISKRYGDIILFDPPFAWRTLFLWFGPFIFLAIAILLALGRIRFSEKA